MSAPEHDHPQPLVAHLTELRSRILRALLAILVAFLALFPFSNELYHWVALPLQALLPAGQTMIATEVASPFLAPFKLTLMAALLLAIPVVLYQIWAFVAPALYRHERRLLLPLLGSSVLLFYAGVAFAYFVVFPLVFGFFSAAAPEGVAVMTDISRYLDFVITLFIAFGCAFEIPVAIVLMAWAGVLDPYSLADKRPYIVVGCFIVGMLLTPPDVISQTLLALPMWALFEIGVLFAKALAKRNPQTPA